MPNKRGLLGRLAAALAKTEARPAHNPLLYSDEDLIRLAQEKFVERTQPKIPKRQAKRPTGKWYEIGQLKESDVSEHDSGRLQYYFDKASTPATDPGYSNVNYWTLYFAEMERHGGDWSASDWSKWRAWYFSVNPDRREAHNEYDKAYRARRQRERRASKRNR